MMEWKSYVKREDIPENKEIFIYGFKHINTAKIDNYILFGCESDESYENDKLFNFWSNEDIKKEIENRNLKIPRCFFMTLVKKTSFFKFRAYV